MALCLRGYTQPSFPYPLADKLTGTPAPDAADALAAALCHGHQHRLRVQLGNSGKLAGIQ